jgi:tellurite methyltransferase
MGIARWNQRFLEHPEAGSPLPLVVTTAQQLRPGRALDLACGTGRNALWLSQQGWSVTAVDGSPAAIAALNGVTAILADLETGQYQIEESVWDLIVITYYLQRDLFEPAKAGLRPGGTLIAIALLSEPGEEPKAHRLRPGELARYFDGWEILHEAETAQGSRAAEVVARKPTLPAR